MFHIFECTVRVRFDDEEVISDLVDNEVIDEEDAENYEPTSDDLRNYAWQLIENDEGEYESPYECL